MLYFIKSGNFCKVGPIMRVKVCGVPLFHFYRNRNIEKSELSRKQEYMIIITTCLIFYEKKNVCFKKKCYLCKSSDVYL